VIPDEPFVNVRGPQFRQSRKCLQLEPGHPFA
jgi:hypothetical protein